MNWVWFIGGTWLAVGSALAVLIGRSIHYGTIMEEPRADEVAPKLPVPLPTPPAATEQQAPAGRHQKAPTATPIRPRLTAGCVPPTQRIPSQHKHGIL